MTKSSPKVKAKKPKNVFTKPLKADFKGLFKALSKGIGHTAVGKWEEIGVDTVEALSAIGLSTDPGELAYLLVRRSITRALFDLVGESAAEHLVETKKKTDDIIAALDISDSGYELHIDRKFLDRPGELPMLEHVKDLLGAWLREYGVSAPIAEAITHRLPTYFVYALNQEWRKNAKSYRPLIEALDTPFSKAGEREWAWAAYNALLQRRVDEGVFDEPFSLLQIYVPLNAYYLEDRPKKDVAAETIRPGHDRRRVVVKLQEELESWIDNPKRDDTIRVISGGPGCGKSCFARIFAQSQASKEKIRVLFVPLHLIDPSKEIVEEVGRFVRDEGILDQNPLDADSAEPNLLLIFDGLDELASQGKAAAETARAFIREIDRTVEKRNSNKVRLRVLISGRELIVQENESEFRRPRQILNILPYYLGKRDEAQARPSRPEEDFHDPNELLKQDLRQKWWENYGRVTDRGYEGLPKELARTDLEEITAQPLLNYLVALTFTRKKLDFSKNVNLNAVYEDLVTAVHERAYEKKRRYVPIRHMTLQDFMRVLEEVGLAAWHGDGRTTTVREIEEHCRASGVGSLLDTFEEGAKAGVTRLLAAFFFRQYGRRPSGDPTFVFTHKSFGEYLAARRVVRAMERIVTERRSRRENLDAGWDECDALKHWAQVCGPSPISEFLYKFLMNELRLRKTRSVQQNQTCFTELFSYVLRHGMPMELLPVQSFRVARFQSRNSEEALLVALNACARVTERISMIEHPDPTAFGTWFKRIQGQRSGPESVLAARCLSLLNLQHVMIYVADLYGSCVRDSNLQRILATFACLTQADLEGATLQEAKLEGANLGQANLQGANLEGAILARANLAAANLERAILEGAILARANLAGANLEGAILEGAILEGANLEGAILEGAILEGASLEGANLEGAILEGASLEGANLEGANLEGAILEGANLEGANLRGAKMDTAVLAARGSPPKKRRKRSPRQR